MCLLYDVHSTRFEYQRSQLTQAEPVKARKASVVLLRPRCATRRFIYKHHHAKGHSSRRLDSVNSFPIPISRKYRNTLAIWPSIIIVLRDVFGTKHHIAQHYYTKQKKENMRVALRLSTAAAPPSPGSAHPAFLLGFPLRYEVENRTIFEVVHALSGEETEPRE